MGKIRKELSEEEEARTKEGRGREDRDLVARVIWICRNDEENGVFYVVAVEIYAHGIFMLATLSL